MTANEKSITVFFILICEKLCGPVNKTNLLKESDYERFSLKNYKHSKKTTKHIICQNICWIFGSLF
jgi:hypothetical protein